MAAPQEMTPDQLLLQVQQNVGRMITYRAYPAADTQRRWRRFAGKLVASATGGYAVEVGPRYNYIPLCEQHTEDRIEPIPAPGWIYTRIVATTVFMAEYIQHLEQAHHNARQQLEALKAEVGAGGNWWERVGDDEEGDGSDQIPGMRARRHDPNRAGGDGSPIESDLVALSPEKWDFSISQVMRLVTYLGQKFNAVLSSKQHRHIAQDNLSIIQNMAMVNTVARVQDQPQWKLGMRVPLKRLILCERSLAGHGGAYIAQLAQAMDGSGAPQWIQDAEKQAASVLKNTHLTKGTQGGKGGKKGGN